jgi:hypothetical protein
VAFVHAAAPAAPLALLSLKLLLSPALIGVATWIARRWGPSVGGWFVALPHTSAPVALAVALERGPALAADACAGITLAVASLAVSALVYSWSARRAGWPVSCVAACAAYLACTWPLQRASVSLVGGFAVACLVLTASLCLMPSSEGTGVADRRPAWDLPLRMALAATLVWLLSLATSVIGPRLAGLLTPFPIAAIILAACTHHFGGGAAAGRFLRGLLTGLFSFAVFFLIAGLLLREGGISNAFTAAAGGAMLTHAVTGLFLRGGTSSGRRWNTI